MPRPTNKQVVGAFVNHRPINIIRVDCNLRLNSYCDSMGQCIRQQLFSYNTIIAEWKRDEGFIYNPTRYSNTTSKHQALFVHYMYEYYRRNEDFNLPTRIYGEPVHIIMDYVRVGTQSLGELQGCTLSRRFQDRYGSRISRVTQRVIPIEQQIIFD